MLRKTSSIFNCTQRGGAGHAVVRRGAQTSAHRIKYATNILNMLRISQAEKAYIEQGVEHNVRNDGREKLDYRHFSLETGIISQTNGSARLKLENTDILVGVKAEIGEPSIDRPNEGRLQFNVECCPSASPEFEGRGADYLNIELSRFLERIFQNSQSFNLQSLCVVPSQTCWILYIDAMVLDSGGNLFDSLCLATLAALHDTKIPSIKVDNIHGDAEEGNIAREIQIEVSDDPEDYSQLDVSGVPLCVTLTKIGGGNYYIVDATLSEEMCMTARLSIAINRHGRICAMQKGGTGGLDAALLPGMLKAAVAISKHMLTQLDNAIEREIKMGSDFHLKVGFFA